MKLAVASGKGGAGKTMVSAALAMVWERPCVVVDADVEAPNLHLFLSPEMKESEPVYLEVPVLNKELCTLCGACRKLCKFGAIAKLGSSLNIFPDLCHGCGGCFEVCPELAFSVGQRELGTLETGTILSGKNLFIMGRSRIGESMTPPLLRAVYEHTNQLLKTYAQKDGELDVIIDSPPGVSCPAVTVARDADILLLVVEPTPFGFYDFKLAHQAFQNLNKPIGIVMNRVGIQGNEHGEKLVREYCLEYCLPIFMELPFERGVAEAYSQGVVISTLSFEWNKRFVVLAEALQRFAKGGTHV
ncbi:4Fe-4S binding protein [Desulfovibrio litoralis]|uniref:MinD superfamily P-loop ATPase, contains an inserted ferredoxin domain n=1 Tax=Desulfovibrio litoralis DSM 11393 TaxID=1121455 RepID=A0A1M7RR22_9BACT|nr:ATP-binding protein [Desulfovibrio litoralis]SHN48556.1 MinD superfamily P-loop ATPase, contains an inserted ferredoxin domain [Desulfovibrio litoralis DSM 11393]